MKQIDGAQNGKTRTVPTVKAPKYYATETVPQKRRNHKAARAPVVRASIAPGKVLILLSGRFRGKRVVCLKVLPSGLLVVTGPFKVNGVPLKRVDPAYVIATSASVDIGAVPEELTDQYFARPGSKLNPSGDFFGKDSEAKEIDPARKAMQSKVDDSIIAAIGAVDNMKDYLRNSFSLKSGQFPHAMKF